MPIWSDIAEAVVKEADYHVNLDPVDLSFYGLTLQRDDVGQINIAVLPEQGGIAAPGGRFVSARDRYQPSIITFGQIRDDGRFQPKRQFLPYWKIMTEEQVSGQ